MPPQINDRMTMITERKNAGERTGGPAARSLDDPTSGSSGPVSPSTSPAEPAVCAVVRIYKRNE